MKFSGTIEHEKPIIENETCQITPLTQTNMSSYCLLIPRTGMKHHFEVSRYLSDLDNEQIVQVGLALGMNYAKLKRMRSLPGDMVAAWLRREDDVLEVSGVPTWKALSEALKDNGQTGLAMKIQQKRHNGISL
jgi:hypothetical protein